ncbi:MAG: UDP-N-acetylmuramate dehydrogenase [Bdellovibrionaceae bacterium]|nr:UDP-N-acetylmuramate dehydrogenase [Pseudobdellovibrionaceae bacterium]
MEFIKNKNLKEMSWWKAGGHAELFCQPKTVEELKRALIWAKENQKHFSVLGGGTNVLISDKGIKGLVISTSKLNSCSTKKTENSLLITCGAGLLKAQLMKIFKTYKLSPALFLSGLPGDVGGGVVMNAGVNRSFKPSEFSEIVKSFKVMNAESEKTYLKKDIKWSYRESLGWDKSVIYEVEFEWPLIEITDINDEIKKELKKRRASQPLDKASCGSVFKNPYPHFAGEVIEKSGLKGLKQGSAQISEKHANFIINTGNAKTIDIHKLIQIIKKRVFEKFSIHLETEVHYMGVWD